jgi:hypothetical protein
MLGITQKGPGKSSEEECTQVFEANPDERAKDDDVRSKMDLEKTRQIGEGSDIKA